MKIACYFNGKTSFGGAERRIGRIMNGVAARGIAVEFVFTLFEPMERVVESYKRVLDEPCRIEFRGFSSGSQVFKYVKNSHFDVVFYIGAYKSMIPFFLAGKLGNSRTVLLQVSTGPSVGKFNSIIEAIGFDVIARNSDYIDCLYPSTTTYFRRKYKKQHVFTTPCPSTNTSTFYPKDKEKIITFISRWVEGKNVELFVDSVLEIEDELEAQGYRVYLCGSSQDGKIEERVSRRVETAKHPDIIIQPGYIEPETVLPISEVFMSLQSINNYPSQSLLEAIACGCYIIASDEGDTRLLVRPEFGACCKLEPTSIASEILAYIDIDDDEKQSIKRSARSFAENTFNIEDSIEHYIGIINRTLE